MKNHRTPHIWVMAQCNSTYLCQSFPGSPSWWIKLKMNSSLETLPAGMSHHQILQQRLKALRKTERQKSWKCFIPSWSVCHVSHPHPQAHEEENVTVGKHSSTMAEQKNPSTLCVMHAGQWSTGQKGISGRAFQGTAEDQHRNLSHAGLWQH